MQKTRKLIHSQISLNKHTLILLIITILLGIALFYRLGSVPPLWYDEGWILTVSRNWAQYNYYGHFLTGKPIPVTLMNTGKPATILFALSFKLLGVGGYQGRLVSAILTLFNIRLLYGLTRKLYNPAYSIASVLCCLFILPSISFNTAINPIIIGRQAMGEMPALFYLLLGYVFLINIDKKANISLPMTIVFFGLAGLTKLQTLPFIILGLIVPAGVMWIKGERRYFILFLIILFGLTAFLLIFKSLSPIFDQGMTRDSQQQILSTTAAVPTLSIHQVDEALSTLIVFALPTLIGYIYSLTNWEKNNRHQICGYKEYVKLSLISLGVGWVIWFIFLSVGWSRYIFILSFLGCIFIAAMIGDLTHQYDISYVLNGMKNEFKICPQHLKNFGVLLFLALLTFYAIINLFGFYYLFTVPEDHSLQAVVKQINSMPDPETVVESFEPELFIYINKPYHFPPDDVQLQLVKQDFLGSELGIDYDPTVIRPDLLVIGPTAKQYGLYKRSLSSGGFRLWQDYGRYQVYTRVKK